MVTKEQTQAADCIRNLVLALVDTMNEAERLGLNVDFRINRATPTDPYNATTTITLKPTEI